MEDLTKHQFILLVLLIAFITSIATGIITFTLLSEAPVEVTQTINRVVEKTIERVVPEEGKPEKVVTTVVVTEEDRVLEAITKNEKSIVRLKTVAREGLEIFAGIGLIVQSAGTIVTDIKNYNPTLSYSIFFHDGKRYPIDKVYVDNTNGLVFMKISPIKDDHPKYVFYPAVFGNSDILKIGQTLIAINGEESNAISIGRISQLETSDDKTVIKNIVSNIEIIKGYPGSPVLNLSGEVVGIEASFLEKDTKHSYIPINIVKTAIPKALEELAR